MSKSTSSGSAKSKNEDEKSLVLILLSKTEYTIKSSNIRIAQVLQRTRNLTRKRTMVTRHLIGKRDLTQDYVDVNPTREP